MQEKIRELQSIITGAVGQTVALGWIEDLTEEQEYEHVKDVAFGKLCGFLWALKESGKLRAEDEATAAKIVSDIRWKEEEL